MQFAGKQCLCKGRFVSCLVQDCTVKLPRETFPALRIPVLSYGCPGEYWLHGKYLIPPAQFQGYGKNLGLLISRMVSLSRFQ